MRLVWVVIPLVLIVSLIGIVGMQESFAQYMGNIGDGDEFEYTLEEALEIQKLRIKSAQGTLNLEDRLQIQISNNTSISIHPTPESFADTSNNLNSSQEKIIISETPVESKIILEIHNPDHERYDKFGHSIASTPDGDILVAMFNPMKHIERPGIVYLFDGISGETLLEIHDPDPERFRIFANSLISTTDGNILVGASGELSDNVYLFDGITGDLLLEITNPGSFIFTVTSTPDGNILSSTYGIPWDLTPDGFVYLFDGVTGELLLEITNPTPEQYEFFGTPLTSTPDGNILVGASMHHGTVYLFDGITGELLLEITNPATRFDKFSRSLASTPDGNILVGAPGKRSTVYLFDGITGDLLLEIHDPDTERLGEFAASLASTPDGNILVGVESSNTSQNLENTAYLFDGITGDLLLEITNPSSKNYNHFSRNVESTSDGNLLISAGGSVGGKNVGSVYLFEKYDINSELTFCGKIKSYYSNIITGTNYDDVLRGTNSNDLILGLNGNDVIYGNKGNDCLIGGTGNDMIFGGDGKDIIYGDNGHDKLFGGDGNDTIRGGEGNDIIYGNEGHDKLFGGDGNDTIRGDHGHDKIYGMGGKDILLGNHGIDRCDDPYQNTSMTTCEK